VGEAVLRAAEEGEGVAEEEAHGLAPAGNRDVQGGVGVCAQFADLFGDEVGADQVVRWAADVVHERPGGRAQDVDVIDVEGDLGQRIVAAHAVEPAQPVRQQREAGAVSPLGGGDQVNLGRDEGRVIADRERMQGFGDDLRRQPGHGEQDPPWIRCR
jgi:hypothetical protein